MPPVAALGRSQPLTSHVTDGPGAGPEPREDWLSNSSVCTARLQSTCRAIIEVTRYKNALRADYKVTCTTFIPWTSFPSPFPGSLRDGTPSVVRSVPSPDQKCSADLVVFFLKRTMARSTDLQASRNRSKSLVHSVTPLLYCLDACSLLIAKTDPNLREVSDAPAKPQPAPKSTTCASARHSPGAQPSDDP